MEDDRKGWKVVQIFRTGCDVRIFRRFASGFDGCADKTPSPFIIGAWLISLYPTEPGVRRLAINIEREQS
jgi:hypothetical protein